MLCVRLLSRLLQLHIFSHAVQLDISPAERGVWRNFIGFMFYKLILFVSYAGSFSSGQHRVNAVRFGRRFWLAIASSLA